MKIGNLSFGISVVASGVKSSVVNAEPQLVALSTKGGFAITPAVSKALNLAPGDNIMFSNNIAAVEEVVNARGEEITAYAASNGFDLATAEGVRACINSLSEWYIAKGIAKMKANGTPLMATVRLTKEEKQDLLDKNIDDIIAANRDALIEKHKLEASATDDEIKAVVTVDDIASPETPAFFGCKLAANGNQVGVGLKLTCSDTNTWEQLKDGMDDKTAMKRVFDVKLDEAQKAPVNNGAENVEVTFYPIAFKVDEVPTRISKKDAE